MNDPAGTLVRRNSPAMERTRNVLATIRSCAGQQRTSIEIRHKLLVLIIVPLTILLLIVGAVMQLSVNARTAATASQRSNRALHSSQVLLVTLVDMETGMRGYVLTGDRGFLDPYRAAGASLKRRVEDVKRSAQGPGGGKGARQSPPVRLARSC